MKNYTGYARHHNQFSINVHLIKRYKKKTRGGGQIAAGKFSWKIFEEILLSLTQKYYRWRTFSFFHKNKI